MAFSPADSAIKVTKSIEEKVAAATSQAEIQEIFHKAAIDQKLVIPDIYDNTVLLPVELGTQPRGFVQSILDPVTGKKVIFEGATELEVTKQANEFMRSHFTQPAATTPRDSATGRFTSGPRTT